MTDEIPYSKRELDAKFEAVENASNENRHSINNKIQGLQSVLELRLADLSKNTADSLSRIEINSAASDKKIDDVHAEVSFTNGKVRKIIIALVLVFGILIGQNFGNWHDIIGLFAGSVSLN